MSLISLPLKKRFGDLNHQAKVNIHRHPQLTMAEELQQLSHGVLSTDLRDNYGRGGTLHDFEQQLRSLFASPSCLFLPTGTLAQCAALKCYSQQTARSKIALHPTSHLLLHEHRAIEHLWRLEPTEMGAYHCVLSVNDVCQLNPHETAAIVIETPMRELGGGLPSWDDLLRIRAWCDQHEVNMHLDGARIWQTTGFYQRSLADIASLFDSLYVSFYKDLGGISGAALLGSVELIEQARIWSRRAGGNPITLYPEVLAARAGLVKYLARMPQFIAYTKQVAKALHCAQLNILPEQPQAAMFHLQFDMSAETLAQKIVSYAQHRDIVVLPLPRSGGQDWCTCEISIGENAIAQKPAYWAKHILACLAQ